MEFPSELKYSKDHEWVRLDGDSAYIGITSFAQSELGDIVFVDIDSEGEFLEKVPAYPRYINPQSSLSNAKLQYDKKFKMYERRLMLRSLRFNKEIEREKIKRKLRKKKRENQNWSRLKSYMCTFEK